MSKTLLAEYFLDNAEIMLNDYYQGCFDSEVDFPWQLFDVCYAHQMPNSLIYYFDCVAFARDLFMSDYCSVNANVQTHIFTIY
jgi:antirestriction protein